MADEQLDELYEVKPEDFTALRTRLAAQAKERGDMPAARRIGASRKPTTAAWVVNRLTLRNKNAARRLADLGKRLRVAHAGRDGDHIRELSREQRELIHELARAAFDAAELTDPAAALRDDVTDTLQAAIADPDVAGRLGRLTKAQRYSGFGDPGDAAAESTRPPVESAEADSHDHAAQAVRRRCEKANAALAAAEKAKAAADDALSERQSELDAARCGHHEARTALREAERRLAAAEDAHDEAVRASHDAAQRVTDAKARLEPGRD